MIVLKAGGLNAQSSAGFLIVGDEIALLGVRKGISRSHPFLHRHMHRSNLGDGLGISQWWFRRAVQCRLPIGDIA